MFRPALLIALVIAAVTCQVNVNNPLISFHINFIFNSPVNLTSATSPSIGNSSVTATVPSDSNTSNTSVTNSSNTSVTVTVPSVTNTRNTSDTVTVPSDNVGTQTRSLQTTSTPSPEVNNTEPITTEPSVSFDSTTPDLEECDLSIGGVGQCVPFYKCPRLANRTNVAVISNRFSSGTCTSYIDTCCDLRETSPLPGRVKRSSNPYKPEREGCGWSNPEGVGVRTMGNIYRETKFGEFPWVCALLKKALANENQPDGERLPVYVGGGSLIHPSVVLTAAQSVAKESGLHVRAGEWDTQTTKEIYPYQDRDITSILIHENFSSHNFFYDVALLFLAKPMDLAPNVGVACLPPPKEEAPVGIRCFTTGWGKDKLGNGVSHGMLLKKVEVVVIDNGKCEQQLHQARLAARLMLHPTFMCARIDDGVSTFNGDEGAPLACPIQSEKDRFVQSGIVSWNEHYKRTGAPERVPGVYVNVGKLRDWIDDKMIGEGYDPKVYTY